MPRSSEQLLCLCDVVRISLSTGVGAAERGWHDAGGDAAAPSHHRAQNSIDVDGVIESLSHAHIAERTAGDIDGDVPESERGCRVEELLLLGISFPCFTGLVRNGEHIDV